MDNHYYNNQLKEAFDELRLAVQKKETFFQQVLFVSSATLGILVSLHSSQSTALYIRLVFALSILLLLLGILISGKLLYNLSRLPELSYRKFVAELTNAISGGRKMDPVLVGSRKWISVCEKISLCLLVLGLISVVTYSLMVVFS
jgi:hypothetical protein